MSMKRTKGMKLRRFVTHSAIPQPKGKSFRQMKIARPIGAKKKIANIGAIITMAPNKSNMSRAVRSICHVPL